MNGHEEATEREDDERTPGAVAYHYPVFGGFPVYYSSFPYASPYTYPFVVASPAPAKETAREAKALGSSAGSTWSKGSDGSKPRAKRSAYPDSEADPQTFYTSFVPPTATYKFPAISTQNVPAATTYNLPAATFPFGSPYTHVFPYTFPFVVANPAVKFSDRRRRRT